MQTAVQHQQAGRLTEAEKGYRQILAAQSDHVGALTMLGMLCGQTGRYAVALDLLQRAAELAPQSAEVHHNLAFALREMGRVDDALSHYARAIQLKPDFANAFRHMGALHMDRGEQDLSLECHRRAVALQPDAADIHSSLLYSLHFRPDYDAQMLLAEHCQWAQQHEKPLARLRRPHENNPDPDRRLKIGYVSADFCNHPVGRFLGPLFDHHNHEQFEICCYADITAVDQTTHRLEKASDRWHIVKGPSHSQLADQIRADRIDILVDLAQHSASNRLLTFARKPAPVQVAWLGYPGTTGMEAIDYRLSDPYLDPPGQADNDYSERTIRLPHCYWCFEPLEIALGVNALPAMQNGYVTFGCMNRFAKVTRATLKAWGRILQALPNSRLLIHSRIGDHLDPVRKLFVDWGIAPRRVEFVERKLADDYLRQYHRTDITLDPFPHGGGTVTCDSLWMGVPVVTLSGQIAVGRGGASLLSNVGLPELIAKTEEEYLGIALGLASDLPRLAELRAGLRQKMKASPLMDAKRFAGDMEAAYRQMWRAWCAGHSR